MKFSFTKWNKTSEGSDRRFWLSSSRRSSLATFESIMEKKSWNFLRRKQKTPAQHQGLDSQSTIIIEEQIENISLVSNKPSNSESMSNLEPFEIHKSSYKSLADSYKRLRSDATIKQSELNLVSPLESPESVKNVFTPRLKSHCKRSGKISPEFLNSPFRRPITPTEFSGSWNSISLRPPPSPSLPPQLSNIQVLNSKCIEPDNDNHTSKSIEHKSIEQSVNAIFQKLINDPTINVKQSYKSKTTKSKSKISFKNLKHLPFYEPLNFSSNVEVFEQDLLKRKTKRAWTSEPLESTKHFSIFSWMSTSKTLNALSLPSVVVPPAHSSHAHTRDHTHERDQSLDHQIELSSLGSFDPLQ